MANNSTSARRLVGADGKLVKVELGDELDHMDTIDTDGWYKITAIAESDSDLPPELSVGDLVYLENGDSLSEGDKVRPLEETDLCDVDSFSLEVNQNEIDVTTLCDGTRRYRGGKIDMSGSLEGVFTLGITDVKGGITNKFFRIIKRAENADVTVHEVDGSPIWLKGVVQKESEESGREAFYWMQVQLLGYNAGAQSEDKQSFTSNFRISAESEEPTLYERELAS